MTTISHTMTQWHNGTMKSSELKAYRKRLGMTLARASKHVGTNTDDNIQLLRKLCNLQKSAKHPVDFMQQRGFLL